MSKTLFHLLAAEECWTLLGRRRGRVWYCRRDRRRAGQPCEVEADGAWTLAREETRGDVLGFLHTHPMGGLSPSRRDMRTMRAWCDALGKPLLCAIATPTSLAAWRFEAGGSTFVRLATVELFPRGILIGVESHGRPVPSRKPLPGCGDFGEAGDG